MIKILYDKPIQCNLNDMKYHHQIVIACLSNENGDQVYEAEI